MSESRENPVNIKNSNTIFVFFFRTAQAVGSIMALILFTMTLICTLVIALDLFAFELFSAFSIELMTNLLDLAIMLFLLLAYCFLSECVTLDLLKIGKIFYESAWYRLPVRQQKLLILPLSRGQRTIRLRCLGLFDCSLVVFCSVRIFIFSFRRVFMFSEINSFFVNTLFCREASFSENQSFPPQKSIFLFFFYTQIIRTAGSYFVILRRFK